MATLDVRNGRDVKINLIKFSDVKSNEDVCKAASYLSRQEPT